MSWDIPKIDPRVIGADRLELSASRPQTGRSTRLSYAPSFIRSNRVAVCTHEIAFRNLIEYCLATVPVNRAGHIESLTVPGR